MSYIPDVPTAHVAETVAAGTLRATTDASELADLPGWRDAARYTDTERLVLEYAEAMSATPPTVSDGLMSRLEAVFPPRAIVELTAVVAMQNMSARFNNALDARAHGFCSLRGAQDLHTEIEVTCRP